MDEMREASLWTDVEADAESNEWAAHVARLREECLAHVRARLEACQEAEAELARAIAKAERAKKEFHEACDLFDEFTGVKA